MELKHFIVRAIGILAGKAVMTLASITRGSGSIPR